MLTIATLLRTGGDFKREHVEYQRRAFQKHLTVPFEFRCLTDDPQHPDDIQLEHNWPGWWSKLEVFKLQGPVFYIDLDMIVRNNIDDLMQGHAFTQLRHFRLPKSPKPNSGLMAWGKYEPYTPSDLSIIYGRFTTNPEWFMKEYAKGGDEAFIRDYSPVSWERWQEKFPGRVVSYKIDCKHEQEEGGKVVKIPETASVICFHGPPRPWDTPLWKEYEARGE